MSGPSGIRAALSLERGEKQVSTLFKSALNLGMVVRPSTDPVTNAVFKPYFSPANALT